ncbi:N-acetyltransferase [Planotetraspora thailandica]|uniref:N-acetyltransferase n=1 Tax=Planotetraspora thailandica TaxID=487172 RepID=A0A8J3V3Q0_9ACTN|nr:GNAT family N-acetyltransferase [Planotetraspora thailandica]GII54987.1 N-acetyltransferase [Planotetraspora thailandica]
MRIERLDFSSSGDGMPGLYAAHRAGRTQGPGISLRHFRVSVERGWSAGRCEAWVARDAGQVAGGYALHCPDADNTHVALIRTLAVLPGHRRRGIGSALLEHAVGRARSEGRRVMIGEAVTGGPGASFAAARGFSGAAEEARRVLDLRTADWPGLELMRDSAARHGRGYSLERWAGPIADHHLDDMAALLNGMNDEPRGDLDIEDRRWNAAQVRTVDETTSEAGLFVYTMIARHNATGDPAGFTRIGVDAGERDGWASQLDTCVLRPHRGRRLGLTLKLANLAWFRACEPDIVRLATWNSTSNRHMLDINEAMGFTVLDIWNRWQLHV